MEKREIRLFKPFVGEDELKNLKDVFDRQWLGLGPLVADFEIKWNEYIGSKKSIAVNSATAALHLALTAFDFPKGKSVLVPAITFVSTATAVLYNGLKPIFVDVCSETLSIDLDDLKNKITDDCVAVIPVHMGGYPVPMDRLMEIAEEHGLAVIEDCAHCAGGSYKGKKLGTWGDIGCFSFEEKKCMTTGDGGMICSDNEELIKPLESYRWVGIDKSTWRRVKRYQKSDKSDYMHWHYEVSVLGYKYNMNDIAAAIGLAQLKKLDKMNAMRRKIIKKYLKGIHELKTIRPVFQYDVNSGVYWFFGIRTKKRDDLILYLSEKGISTGVHFFPLTLHPLFKPYANRCLTAEKIWKTFITLPSYAGLNDEQITYVIEALKGFENRK